MAPFLARATCQNSGKPLRKILFAMSTCKRDLRALEPLNRCECASDPYLFMSYVDHSILSSALMMT
jgi:hypothetical protein